MKEKVLTASEMGKKSWKNRVARDPIGVREKMREMGYNSGVARRKKRDEKLVQEANINSLDKLT